MTMHISRPTITIVPSRNGKTFTYEASAESWDRIYTRKHWFNSAEECGAAMKRFSVAFNNSATAIEDGSKPRKHLMGTLVDNGKFVARAKLTDDFSDFTDM